jgi:hypothetical protein
MSETAITARRQAEYNGAADGSRLEQAFLCLVCRDLRWVRVDAPPMSAYFAMPIPCPCCNTTGYDRFVEKHGVPPKMPKWAEG